jgi:hypothetical protein
MKSVRVLLSFGAIFLAGCAASNLPYRMHSEPESTEWWRDSLDVYPEDVRQDPAQYSHTAVAWAGVIRHSEADDFGDGYIRIRTTFEHHYFDWEQNDHTGGPEYDLSPHGEGLFKTEWLVKKVDPDASAEDAQKYAAPGKLVLIYGVPTGVDTNGVVQLRYRFLHLIDSDKYSTYEFDYGRFGQPVVYLK